MLYIFSLDIYTGISSLACTHPQTC